ncbi:MAG: amino acid ABC transporter substrate-binding protein [Candidatus Methylomirabilales bacterium]
MMRQKTIGMWGSLMLLTCGVLAIPVGQAEAETVLTKISRTGKLTAGTRTASIPFAFRNDKGEWVGFSVDLIKAVHRRLERNLVRKITLELKEVNPKNRISLVADGTIDIECGSTTYTRSRDEKVDFSVNFFYTGAQVLVKKGGGIKDARDLVGKRIGVTEGTTTERILRANMPQARLVLFSDHDKGFQALQEGKVDAYSTDGILLAGLAIKSPNPKDFGISGFFSKEPYACILPENDSKWRDFVNHTFMELIENGTYLQLYDKWFGEKGVVPYQMPPVAKAYILLQVMPR